MGIDEYMGSDDFMAIEEPADNRNQETQMEWSMYLHDVITQVNLHPQRNNKRK